MEEELRTLCGLIRRMNAESTPTPELRVRISASQSALDIPVALGELFEGAGNYGSVRDEWEDEAAKCPVHYAAEAGHAAVLDLLLGAGASPDVSYNSLFASVPTPLWTAAERGNAAVVSTLLRGGADPELRQPPLGWTALHVATARAHVGAVQALIRGGASPTPRDRDGHTPFQLVSQRIGGLDASDAWELERVLVALGERAPVSHEARMSGVDTTGNWCSGGGAEADMRRAAAACRRRYQAVAGVLQEEALLPLATAQQRLLWARAANSGAACSAWRWLSDDLLEAVGTAMGMVAMRDRGLMQYHHGM
jgi:hypothetical protein